MDRLNPQTNANLPSDPTMPRESGTFSGGVPSGGFDPWRYRDEVGIAGTDLVGYKVEATDGGIGKIDRASHEVNESFLVVDTGPWIFGKKVMLPAGVVNHVDHDARKVYVDRGKEQIKAAPEYDEAGHADPVYRDKLGGYYGDTYGPAGTTRPPQGLL